MIFVFGSNLAGRHGMGAAKYALDHHGAVYGQAEGIQGNSYAIPTKNAKLRPLSIKEIDPHIAKFVFFARDNPDLTFALTPIGCGLAGHSKRDILSIFRHYAIGPNVYLTSTWVTD
jgi:hypothetical protein